MHDSGEDIDIRNFVSTEFLYDRVILFQGCNFLFCFKQFLHKFTYRFKHIHKNCFSPIYICMISTSFTSKHEPYFFHISLCPWFILEDIDANVLLYISVAACLTCVE